MYMPANLSLSIFISGMFHRSTISTEASVEECDSHLTNFFYVYLGNS